jgi:AcrR family transcriptional regulator
MVRTNKQGQALGRKGAETRARLLDAARQLIASGSEEKLTASAIARAAGVASQSLYLYFRDIDELLLHLSKEAGDDAAEIANELDAPWDPSSRHEHAERFVSAFYRYWDRNRAILTIRNFRADRGEEAFVEMRDASAQPIVNRLAEQIRAAGTAKGPTPREALARAIIIVAAIERMASRYATLHVVEPAIDAEDLKRAEADILLLLLTPRA